MLGVTNWLRELGLEQYAPAFLENAIDATVLRSLLVGKPARKQFGNVNAYARAA
jgi:hypothetical protein